VDVPGHERFVRNMLAGAHGIDAVMLVVAADESVMPQTREHFDICRLLGVRRGVVALTKCDVADPDAMALAELETRELIEGSSLEGAPLVRVSALTGEGLPDLRAALLRLAEEAPPRPTGGLVRLPVDRVFSQRGFGTVVTGTLVGGALGTGDEVEILPAGKRARVRGLQVHGHPADRVGAGTRTAVNLVGLEPSELGRGDVLVTPGTMRPTSMVDVEIELLDGARPLQDGARVRVHVASAEVLARVRLLDGERVAPGARALAQLRLERPTITGRGDRLVLRSYSPARTIGGARVLDPLPRRRRRADREGVERLRAASDLEEAAEAMVVEAGPAGVSIGELAARLAVPVASVPDDLEARGAVRALGPSPGHLVSREALRELAGRSLAALRSFHRENPLRPGMPREELRRRVFAGAPPSALEAVLEQLTSEKKVRVDPETVADSLHRVRFAPEEERAREAILAAARDGGLSGVDVGALSAREVAPAEVLRRVGAALAREGELVRVGESLLVEPEALESLARDLRGRFAPGEAVSVPAFKELTGLTRKHVIPLLEYLDRVKVTRRSGGERVVLAGPPVAEPGSDR